MFSRPNWAVPFFFSDQIHPRSPSCHWPKPSATGRRPRSLRRVYQIMATNNQYWRHHTHHFPPIICYRRRPQIKYTASRPCRPSSPPNQKPLLAAAVWVFVRTYQSEIVPPTPCSSAFQTHEVVANCRRQIVCPQQPLFCSEREQQRQEAEDIVIQLHS